MGTPVASAATAAVPASPATAPAADSVDNRLSAAKDLLVAMQAKEMFKSQFEASLPKQMASIQKEYPDMSKETRDLIERAFREETDRSLDGLMIDIATLYAKRFSADEMKVIANFHRTKAGAKLRGESEALQKELSGVANTWSLEVVRKISKRLQEQLREQYQNPKVSS
ncbi:MAG TPA: hypothetical protein DCL48_03510 [Alphaproteobacteria bacterium]|nr:hypothetical protein [Alphaproteobacteria bacterium]